MKNLLLARSPSGLFFVIAILLVLCSLNPFMEPRVYDNATYFLGAQAFASTGSYTFNGEPILDWPPFFSFLLSLPMRVGFSSLFVAKLVVLTTVFLSLFFIHKFFSKEGEKNLLCLLAFLLLVPKAFVLTTATESEWPFILLSFLFFLLMEARSDLRFGDLFRGLALANLEEERRMSSTFKLSRPDPKQILSWLKIIASGLVLGLLLLTRYVAVVYIAALFFYAGFRREKQLFTKAIVISLIAGALFSICWLYPVYGIWNSDFSHSTYYQKIDFYHLPSLSHIFSSFCFLFLASKPFEFLGMDFVAPLLGLFFVVVTCVGLYGSLKEKGLRYFDSAMVLLIGVALIHSSGHTRYLVPAAPFIFLHFLRGLTTLTRYVRVAIAMWAVWIILIDSVLLFYGDDDSHNGLSYLVNRDEKAFYKGRWKELYEVCAEKLPIEPQGDLALHSVHDTRYVVYFSKRHIVSFDQESSAPFLLTSKDKALSKQEVTLLHFTPLFLGSNYCLYCRAL